MAIRVLGPRNADGSFIPKRPTLPSVWAPEGYVWLPVAMNRLGERLYPAEWTGLELWAGPVRDDPFSKNPQSLIKANEDVLVVPYPSDCADERLRARWKQAQASREWYPFSVNTVDGWIPATTKEEAETLAATAIPAVIEKARAEKAAYERQQHVINQLRNECFSGRLVAYVLNRSAGGMAPIPYGRWAMDDASAFFSVPPSQGAASVAERILGGRVFLRQDAVCQLLGAKTGNQGSAPKPTSQRPADEPGSGPGRIAAILSDSAKQVVDPDAWYQERVRNCTNRGIIPSRDDDEAWGREVGIKREEIRNLRKKHAPSNWQAAGKRSVH